jgi:hypothetical protein
LETEEEEEEGSVVASPGWSRPQPGADSVDRRGFTPPALDFSVVITFLSAEK